MTLPADLRQRVLTTSLAARGSGRPAAEAPPISAAAALARAADAFDEQLDELSAADWRTPALRDLDVQGLVGHLIGDEQDVQRALAGDESVADVEHVASTRAVADAQAGRPVTATRDDWRRAVDRTLREVEGSDDHVLAMHGMRLSVDALLVVRAFELWTHENDIRTAVGAPPSRPDTPVLTLMTRLAVQLLPHAYLRRRTRPATALHLVLTGPGGGTYDLHLGGHQDPADDLLLVVDAVDFCRLVANRLAPAALEVQVDGPGATDVLVAAASLALD
jgi:uncharacterized protein (TIGR03083 family)